jgi:hypothetical protein
MRPSFGAAALAFVLIGCGTGIVAVRAQLPAPASPGLADDLGLPAKGHFRLESRDPNTLAGPYQRDGTAIGFSWTATRAQSPNLTQARRTTISGRMDRLFSSFLAFPTTDRT